MKRFTFGKRVLAFILTFALILSVFPAMSLLTTASAAPNSVGTLDAQADGATLNTWMDTFNPKNISTEHAGGVWTDKSVVLKKDIATVFGNIPGLEAEDNNFLVALSALGANSVVVGQGMTPTDTVFVLDISGSMESSELSAMVTAANDSIHTLLSANENSRVGVVLYSTSASVLLPLDRYTPVTEDQGTETTIDDEVEYIELTDDSIRTARLVNREWVSGGIWGGYWRETPYAWIKNGQSQNVNEDVSLGGGTYIQGGLWKAWQQFDAISVTDHRTPVMVLMSDGAPTYTTHNYNNVPSERDQGNGNGSVDGDAFVTQLTAAYVKESMSQKYSTTGYMAAAYFYTLGLGVGSSGSTVSVAEAVLDTDKVRPGIENYWDSFLELANNQTKTMSVAVTDERYNNYNNNNQIRTTNVTVTYDDIITENSREFVDRAFSASNASGLSSAFKQIVSEISLQSGYYTTRLDESGANSSGYVTFVDEIGAGMEFKELEGILIGQHLYTGELLAKAALDGSFGDESAATSLGDNLVWSVKERLRIQDANGLTATEIARDLLSRAFAAGQISYNTSTGEYSNYIAWFGDANGNYVGFWDNNDPYAAIPANAAYANICYGMLGSTTDSQTAHASDLLYVAIQVSKKITEVSGEKTIEDRTPQTVTFRIPAALLPVVTYQIQVEADSGEEVTEQTPAKIVYNAAEPIRLVYEVGVHSAITPENISTFVQDAKKDGNGNYYLYTNAWAGSDKLDDTGKNSITFAYFEPGEDNEHYYFTEPSLVYVENGSDYVCYEGDTQPNPKGDYYFKHLVYKAMADPNDPSKEVTATISEHYEKLSEEALKKTEQTKDAQTWYVPEDTMHRNMHDHNLDKTTEFGANGNVTESFSAIRHQLVDTKVNGDDTHHYEIVYMGNNGRVTYSPGEGFSLTKDMVAGDTAEGQNFSFTVTITGDDDNAVTVNQNGASTEKTLNSGKLELSLKAGETVTVTGLSVGASYTIEENVPEGYQLSNIATGTGVTENQGVASGTVQSNTVHTVTFFNTIQHYGSLLITKTVTYDKNSKPAEANSKQFPVKLTLTGMGGKKVYIDGVDVTLQPDGTHTFSILDGQAINVTGIPEDTEYTVEELRNDGTNVPYGFDAKSGYTATQYNFTGMIDRDDNETAAIQNIYTPADVILKDGEPKINVQVNKNLTGTYPNWSFDFVLKKYDGNDWVEVKVGGKTVKVTATESNPNPTMDLKGVTLDTVGVHYFRVEEVIPEEQTLGMIYDRTFHDFKITVVDDLTGQLKIQSIEPVQHAEVAAPTDPNGDGKAELWDVTAKFNNEFIADSTKLTIQANKELYNITTDNEVKMDLVDGQFSFTLYDADSTFTNLSERETSRNGIAGQIIFKSIPYEFAENASEKTYYYVIKENAYPVNGYQIDASVYRIKVTVKQVNDGAGGSKLSITEVKVWKAGEAEPAQGITLAAGNILNGNTIQFKNTYQATKANAVIRGTKHVNNITPGASSTVINPEDGQFTFTLTGLNNAPMPATTSVTNTGSTFVFPEITYDTVGTYSYTITENEVTVPGYRKDATVHNVTVQVTDNGQGALSATVLYDGQDSQNGAVFTNIYKAEAVTDVVIRGSKTLNVDTQKFTRKLKSGEFTFLLKDAQGTTLETVHNDESGNFVFSARRFDTLGTYEYTVTEVGAGTVKNGVTYDTGSYKVTVTVTDTDLDGKLEADVVYERSPAAPQTPTQADFVNTYNATPVEVQLTAHKYLTGIRDLEANEFRFTMTKLNDPTFSPQQKWNAADGTVTFDEIEYTAVGEHVYTIVEDMVDKNGQPIADQNGEYFHNGVYYSQMIYTVTVKVIDNGFGALVAHVTSVDNYGNELPAQFFNRYKAESVTVNLTGENGKLGGKTLVDKTGSKDLSDFDFRFVLTDEAGQEIETVTDNDVNGFKFTEIEFTEPGEYVYYIFEKNENVPGVIYDTAKYKVTVKITDNKQGALKAELAYEKLGQNGTGETVDAIAFANTYEAKKTSVTFTGNKNFLGGRNLKAGEFSFVLKDAQGAVLETVKNDASGKFTFSTIEYTREGSHVYKLTEIAGADSKVTYDVTEYVLTVTVKDVAGELVATTEITADGKSAPNYNFTNIFAAEGVGTTITVKKILVNNTDKVMGLNDFTFDLYCVETNKTVSVVSGTDGLAKFDLEFAYGDVGKTYTYHLSEKKGSVEGMIYSNTVYEIKVAVTQNGETGELVLTVTQDGKAATGQVTFTNVLNEVSDLTDVPPKTGDDTIIGAWIMTMIVSAVAMLAVLVVGRKKLKKH